MKRAVKIKINKKELPSLLQIINLVILGDNQSADIISMAMSAAFRDMAEKVEYKIFLSEDSEKIKIKISEFSAILFFGTFKGDVLLGSVYEKEVADKVNSQIEEQLFKSGKYRLPPK